MTEQVHAVPAVEIRHHYVNGFQLNLSNADVNGILLLNGVPEIAVSMSFTTAKTLAVALNEMIAALEKVTGRSIMTTNDVGTGMEKLAAEAHSNDGLH